MDASRTPKRSVSPVHAGSRGSASRPAGNRPRVSPLDIRHKELKTIIRNRHGIECRTEMARAYVREMGTLLRNAEKLVMWAELWAPDIPPAEVREIARKALRLKRSSGAAGTRIQLKLVERAAWGIKTIDCYDASPEVKQEAYRLQRNLNRQEARWAQGTKPHHLSDTVLQPWVHFGRSKRWWHRLGTQIRNDMRNKVLAENGTSLVRMSSVGRLVPDQNSATDETPQGERPSVSAGLCAAAGQVDGAVFGGGAPDAERGGLCGPPLPNVEACAVAAAEGKSRSDDAANLRVSSLEVTPPVPSAPVLTSVGAPLGAPDAVVADGDGEEVEALPEPLDFLVSFQHADNDPFDWLLNDQDKAETVEPDDAGLDDYGAALAIFSTSSNLDPAEARVAAPAADPSGDERDPSEDHAGDDLNHRAARIGPDQEDTLVTLNDLHAAATRLPPAQRQRLWQLLDLPGAEDDLAGILILAQTGLSDEAVMALLAKRAASVVEGLAWPAAVK